MNLSGWRILPEEMAQRDRRWSRLGQCRNQVPLRTEVSCPRQGYGTLQMGRSIVARPLTLGEQSFDSGFGTHADSEIVIRSSRPLARLRAVVGVDANPESVRGDCRLSFTVVGDGRECWQSAPLTWRDGGLAIDVDLADSREVRLLVRTDNTHLAHADWCAVRLVTADGAELHPDAGSELEELFPVRFCYGGRSSEELLPQWGIVERTEAFEGGRRRIFTSRHPEDGFEFTFTLDEYRDFPAVCWRVGFAQRGAGPSQRLNEVRTVEFRTGFSDLWCARGAGHDPNGTGSGMFRDNFKLEKIARFELDGREFKGAEGRPSGDWLPFFNLSGATGGNLVAIGWSGQWQARFTAVAAQGTTISGGMEFLDTVLAPGEAITQPSTLVIEYAGADFRRGANLLRRFLNQYWIPEAGRQMPLCCPIWGIYPEAEHLKRLAVIRREQLAYDYYWIDTGWYGDGFWLRSVGSWEVNRQLYPNGLRGVARAAHAAGLKLLVWFEPERIGPEGKIREEHPEYLFPAVAAGGDAVLNLGHPAARQWMLDMIESTMRTGEIDSYRQDFNIDPLAFWRRNDTPERVGMSEIRAIEGLYWVLDELRRRFPGLLIDNCASGGRRIELEMLRRSVPLWITDMPCFVGFDGEIAQPVIDGMHHWLGNFGFGTMDRPGDTYNFRSTLAPGMNFHLFGEEDRYVAVHDDYPFDWQRERIAEFHRVKAFLTGDFYPLTPQSTSPEAWQVTQFDRPDLGAGCVVALRRTASPFAAGQFRLAGLEPQARYRVEVLDDHSVAEYSGEALADHGLDLRIDTRRTSRLIVYQRIG